MLALLLAIIGAVHVHGAIGSDDARSTRITECPEARMTCLHQGYMFREQCQRVLKGNKQDLFSTNTTCICPAGYYGTECQFTSDASTCSSGTVYSSHAISPFAAVESECVLDYTSSLCSNFFALQDHRIRLKVDPEQGVLSLVVLSRPISVLARAALETQMFFEITASDCIVTALEEEPNRPITTLMSCSRKSVKSCLDSPRDKKNCPSFVSTMFKLWGKTQSTIDVKFQALSDGENVLAIILDNLRGIGRLEARAMCRSGSCVVPFHEPLTFNVGTPKEDESEAANSFMIIAVFALTVVALLIFALASAVVRVMSELHRTPALQSFQKNLSSSSSSLSLTAGHIAQHPRKRGISRGLFWDGLSYRLRPSWMSHQQGACILQTCSSKLIGPELVALVGRSGCGKSTLLDLLAGVYKPGNKQGSVGLIGANTSIGYVTQNDVLFPALTVWETISFAARLRSPEEIPEHERQERVVSILAALGLEAQAYTIVSKLSGGETRRLGLAVDLVCQPDVLLLDEPTSGLDSVNASLVVHALRDRVNTNSSLIVMSIHQPAADLFGQFDRLILMGHGGRIVFNGSPNDAIKFVEDHTSQAVGPGSNPFEFILNALDDGDNLDAMVAEHSASQEQVADTIRSCQLMMMDRPDASQCPTSFITQVIVLCKRSFRNSARSGRHLLLYYVITIVVALSLGLVFFKVNNRTSSGGRDRLGFFSCSSLFLSLISFSSLDLLLSERIIQRKECPSSYSCAAYMTSKLITDIVPFRLLPAMLFSSIVYGLVGLQSGVLQFLVFVLIITLVSLAAGASTMLISFLTTDTRSANLTAVLYYLFNFCFGSTLISSRDSNSFLKLLRPLSFFSYATQALCAVEFNGIRMIFDGQDSEIEIDGEQFLMQIGLRVSNLFQHIVCLITAIIIIYALSFIALCFDSRRTCRPTTWLRSSSNTETL